MKILNEKGRKWTICKLHCNLQHMPTVVEIQQCFFFRNEFVFVFFKHILVLLALLKWAKISTISLIKKPFLMPKHTLQFWIRVNQFWKKIQRWTFKKVENIANLPKECMIRKTILFEFNLCYWYLFWRILK